MAVSTSAMSLTDYALISNDPRVMKITQSLLINGSVLADIPLFDKKTLLANGVRWTNNLPNVTWGKLNTEPTVTKGQPTPYQEQLYLIRNAVDVDHFLVEDENSIQDPRAAQLSAWLTALSYDFNDKFINNDQITGEDDAPVGLKSRLDDYTSYGIPSEMKVNCNAVDLSLSGMTAATVRNFLEYIEAALTYMGTSEGDGVVFYMNDYMLRRFRSGLFTMGTSGGLSVTEDQFGRSILKYKNARLVDIGRKADQTTRIITATETSAGASGSDVHTSIYGVRFGEEFFSGWQFKSLGESITDVGLIGNAGTILRTVIDWGVGFYQQHTRCITRLYGIKMA